MFKVLTDGCQPTRGTRHGACVDLFASEDVTMGAGSSELVGLGVVIDLDTLFKRNWNTHLSLKEAKDRLIDNGVNQQQPSDLQRDFDNFLNSHYLQLMLGSSLSKKLIIANGVGVIDLDYKDEIKIRLHNPLSAEFVEANIKVIGIASQLKAQGYSDKDIAFAQGEVITNIGYSSEDFKIKKGDKIAQVTLLEHKGYLFGVESDVERIGGLGSTD